MSRLMMLGRRGRHSHAGESDDLDGPSASLGAEQAPVVEVDATPDEGPEVDEPTEVTARNRAEAVVHRRIQERRDAVELETRVAFRQLAVCFTGGLLLAGAVIGLSFFTPLFRVRNVEVVGALHETTDSVTAMAGVPDGVTLAEVPVRAVASGVETLPWVRRAVVRRQLPWTVRIEVVERRPVAVVDVEGTRSLVDEDGMVLERLGPEADPGPLPRIVVSSPLPGPGSRWTDAGAVVLLDAARAMPAELISSVDALRMGDEGSLDLVLRDGTPVTMGPAADVERKALVLLAVLEDLARRQVKASAIDVSAAGSPAVRPAP